MALCILSIWERWNIVTIFSNRGFELLNVELTGTLVLTASAVNCSAVRSFIPETTTSLNTNQVNLGAKSTGSLPANMYSQRGLGYSLIYSTFKVSPAFPVMPLKWVHPEITVPKSTLYDPLSSFSKVWGLKTSVTLSVGPLLAVSGPSGVERLTAAVQEESSNPGLSQPGCSSLAS